MPWRPLNAAEALAHNNRVAEIRKREHARQIESLHAHIARLRRLLKLSRKLSLKRKARIKELETEAK